MCNGLQEQYADWVGAQAKVALLEANAICVAHLMSSGDDASLAAVSKAHRAHSGWAPPHSSLQDQQAWIGNHVEPVAHRL